MEHYNSETGRQGDGPSGFGGSQNRVEIIDQGVAAAGVTTACHGGGGGALVAGGGGALGSSASSGGAAVATGGSAAAAAAAAACSPSQSARGKKRGNHRHNQQQINAMEAYFEDYPRPDEIQRNEIARRLGLDPAQVRHWFQNKRAQLKTQSERQEREALRHENDVLRAKKRQCIEALRKNTFPEFSVGGSRQSMEENNLMLENIRLREEKEELKSTILRFMGGQNSQNLPMKFQQNLSIISQNSQNRPITFQDMQNHSIISHNTQNLSITFQNLQNLPIMSQNPQNPTIIPMQNPQNHPIISQNPQNIPLISEANNASAYPVDQALGYASTSITSSGDWLKSINVPIPHEFRQPIIELVVSAAEELKVMSMAAGPLWNPSSADGATSVLNEVQYLATYPDNFGPTRLGYTCEASRHKARVLLNPKQLLNILMDVNEWSYIFSAIVPRALTLEVLSMGEDYNASLQLMAAEYHIPTPLVPNRESFFARYCTKHSEGVWAVVDVSLDNVLPTPGITTCQKRPSGCLIQEMADGSSKITWIEHVYADSHGVSTVCKRLLHSGLGFGAKRWVSTLERQCQRSVTAVSSNVPSIGLNNLLMSSPEWRRGILKLSERMVNNFLFGITGPKAGKWTELHGNFGDNVRLMSTRVMDDPGLPNGTLLSVATSFALSLAPNMVFDFFRDHRSRKEWDIFPNANDYEPVCRISYGEKASNCVSIYKVPVRRPGHMLVLQESWSDPVASHIVFAPTEIGTLDLILSGGDPSICLPLLPSGFTILPDGPSFRTEGSSGTLLTVSFQVLINKSPAADVNVEAASKVAHLLRCSCDKIKLALGAVGPNT